MFEEHLQNTIALVQGNPVIGIGVAVVVLALFYFRPKDMFKLLGFCLLLVVGFYLMTILVETVGIVIVAAVVPSQQHLPA